MAIVEARVLSRWNEIVEIECNRRIVVMVVYGDSLWHPTI
jgi:hypothetical protein